MNYYSYNAIPDDEHRMGYPSSRRRVLDGLVGKTVKRITSMIFMPPEEEAAEFEHKLDELFSLGFGGVRVEMENGFLVCFASQPSWASISVTLLRWDSKDQPHEVETPASDQVDIEADDPVYSQPRYAALLGKRIESVTVLQREKYEGHSHLPFEVGVVLRAEDGSELIFGHGLREGGDDFHAITRDEIGPQILPLLHPLP